MKKTILLLTLLFWNGIFLTNAQTYNFVKEISGITQTPPQYQFYNPQGIAADSDDNIYVVDRANNLVSKFSKDGLLLKRWPVVYPNGITIDKNNTVYITQSGLAQVSVYTNNGVLIRKWGTYGSVNYQMKTPYGIALDSYNNVYVADSEKKAVIKYANDGTFIKTWGDISTFTNPKAICIDANDHIYVSDPSKNITYSYDSDGNELQRMTIGGAGITSDKNGFIYIGISYNSSQRIDKYNATTFQYASTYGTMGSGDGQLYSPCGIVFATNGNIYTLEGKPTDGNARVQVFTSSWQYIFKWGGEGNLDKQFKTPSAFFRDADGTLYVSDAGNRRIQKISNAGDFVTSYPMDSDLKGNVSFDKNGNVWGGIYSNDYGIKEFTKEGVLINTWSKSYGTGNGQINTVGKIVIDNESNIYISDYSTRVQKFDNQGNFIVSYVLTGNSNTPLDVAFDPVTTNVFICGYTYPNNVLIYRFNKDGTLINSWSLPEIVTSVNDIVIAADNNLHVSDNLNHQILTYTLDGTFISSFGMFGCETGQIGGISDILFDDNLNLYILEGRGGNSGTTVQQTFGSYDRIQIFSDSPFDTDPVTTVLQNKNDMQNITTFPNPCKGNFTILMPVDKNIDKVTLTNTLGQQQNYFSDQVHTTFKGFIIVTIETSDQQIYHSKVLIE